MTNNQQLIATKCQEELDLQNARLSNEYYYDSLPQCIIDAVFSIGVKYVTTRNTVIKYCEKYNVTRIADPLDTPSDSHTVGNLIENMVRYSDYGAEAVFKNHQRTSSKNGILKAEAVYKFAKVLSDNGIQTISDIRSASPQTISNIETEIKKIKGQKSGISFSYFLMLSGDDNHMKIDRWLLRFVGEALGINRFRDIAQAYADLVAVSGELKQIYPALTPRLLDHTIWSYIKAKESSK